MAVAIGIVARNGEHVVMVNSRDVKISGSVDDLLREYAMLREQSIVASDLSAWQVERIKLLELTLQEAGKPVPPSRTL